MLTFGLLTKREESSRAKNQSYEKDCSIDEEHPLSVPSSIIDNGRWVRAISTNQFGLFCNLINHSRCEQRIEEK